MEQNGGQKLGLFGVWYFMKIRPSLNHKEQIFLGPSKFIAQLRLCSEKSLNQSHIIFSGAQQKEISTAVTHVTDTGSSPAGN